MAVATLAVALAAAAAVVATPQGSCGSGVDAGCGNH